MQSERKVNRTKEEKKSLESRLNRIAGQVNGIKKMIEEDRYCGDVLVQLAAVDKAIRGLSYRILEKHMHHCMTEDIERGRVEAVDEVIELLRRFV